MDLQVPFTLLTIEILTHETVILHFYDEASNRKEERKKRDKSLKLSEERKQKWICSTFI